MAKKLSKIDEARDLFLTTDMTIPDICEHLKLATSSVYKRSSEERWALLKDSNVSEVLKMKNSIIGNRKLSSIEFYEDIMSKCLEFADSSITAKDLKETVSTYILAEDRFFLLAKYALKEDEKKDDGNSGGILDELSKM